MINLKTKEYSNLLCMMYATKHLIDYLDKDIIKYNDIDALDLKYLKSRTDRVTDLITKIENNEN
tara:strand:- start:311 stop:502 length:192 start_codon:yes stop_codon:yes gene_type:complete